MSISITGRMRCRLLRGLDDSPGSPGKRIDRGREVRQVVADTVVTPGTWAPSGSAFNFIDPLHQVTRRVTILGGTLIEEIGSESNFFER